jgi:hypothetical protein
MSQASNDYEGLRLRVPTMPPSERVGDWWRQRWHFRLEHATGGEFRLPPPLGEIREMAMLVSSWWESETLLIVEMITREQELSVDELTYVSLVGAYLRWKFPEGDILVEDMMDHPILKMSRLGPESIRFLREHGY